MEAGDTFGVSAKTKSSVCFFKTPGFKIYVQQEFGEIQLVW